MTVIRRNWGKLPILLMGLALVGCNTASLSIGGPSRSDETSAKAAPPQISGVALPEGYSLDANRTIVLGEGDRWTGRLSYSVNSSADEMFDFIRREMINHGWSEVAVVRAEASQLTYMSSAGDRVASILITRSSLYGARVDMTVSPSATGNIGRPPSARR